MYKTVIFNILNTCTYNIYVDLKYFINYGCVKNCGSMLYEPFNFYAVCQFILYQQHLYLLFLFFSFAAVRAIFNRFILSLHFSISPI